MENEKIYVVMVEGRNTPTKIWNDYNLALNEAKRLCAKERLTAYVCIAIVKAEMNDVSVTHLD